MSARATDSKASIKPKPRGIVRLSVGGFMSLYDQQEIEVRPLTILAGTNSSGKSSIMKPLLLLKQTLEAQYDPGPLLLDGPNVRFTSVGQLLSRKNKECQANSFSVGVHLASKDFVELTFAKKKGGKGFDIESMSYGGRKRAITLRPEFTHSELLKLVQPDLRQFIESDHKGRSVTVQRERCFLNLRLTSSDGIGFYFGADSEMPEIRWALRNVIHLPGLRGNPERTYFATAVGSSFPGTFEKYVASIIAHWQTEKSTDKLTALGKYLEALRLTWKVEARAINDTQVELRVGRMPHAVRGGAKDLVSIADVGFGVSQTLPVLVALLVAQPGQIVYLEQPEIHLHPKAQHTLAEILADAARRGVRVIVETHSSLLIRGIQTIVAKGDITPDFVKLHWFTRAIENGTTVVSSADLNERGAFGTWPTDFDDVALQVESDYLDAMEQRGLSSRE